MKILIVKLSSLGDVLHTLPVVHDIRHAFPDAQIDWVVEGAFAGVVQRCAGVNRVISSDMRTWRKSFFTLKTQEHIRQFRHALQQTSYDAVIDFQGLTKSAVVAWLARLAAGGKRFAMANQTLGSGYEAPTRWVADVAIRLEPRIHAVQRARELSARALGYSVNDVVISHAYSPNFGLVDLDNKAPSAIINIANNALNNALNDAAINTSMTTVIFAHGTSRADKLWPMAHWVELGQRLHALGLSVALTHGNDAEEAFSQQVARQLPNAIVWPRLGLDALVDALAGSAGVVGVDSGLSHIAVALDLPHVQIYNFDTAWRTGPLAPSTGGQQVRQVSVYAPPTPSVGVVWQAWLAVSRAPKVAT